MTALALVWPQGLGARSPGRFGRETEAARIARTTPPPPPPVAMAAGMRGEL